MLECVICCQDTPTNYGVCDHCNSLLPWQKQHYSKLHDYSVFAVFSYQDPIRSMLLDLKFKYTLHHGAFLGNIFAKKLLDITDKHNLPEAILPVPLHIARIRKRGFNQSVELVREISRVAKMPIDLETCVRIKDTAKQSELNKRARNYNIKNAFLSKKTNYKHIALFDDVLTTGNTLINLAASFKANNPSTKIELWCLSRA